MYHDLWLYKKFITRGIAWFSEIGQVPGEAKYLVSDSITIIGHFKVRMQDSVLCDPMTHYTIVGLGPLWPRLSPDMRMPHRPGL